MIIEGDCLDELQAVRSDCIDLVVTDPPYGYSFMGKDWDKAVPSVDIWRECLRVLKPGGFAMVMSAPRSDVQNAMISRLMEAGFRLDFTPIYWTYASGFPKAGNIGKLVDKRLGAEREVVGTRNTRVGQGKTNTFVAEVSQEVEMDVTAPATPQAKALDGSYAGFQPKPAVEVIIVAMKPLSEKTYVDQALKNGKGITWLDDVRSPFGNETDSRIGTDAKAGGSQVSQFGTFSNIKDLGINMYKEGGRFPANLVVDDEVLGDHSKFFTLPFLITPKASKSEKNRGLEGLPKKQNKENAPNTGNLIDSEWIIDPRHKNGGYKASKTPPTANHHPTVKPLKLMSYLITLASRPGDTVLDPFAGSFTTCLAAKKLDRKYIGIEREAEYVEIGKARLAEEVQGTLL